MQFQSKGNFRAIRESGMGKKSTIFLLGLFDLNKLHLLARDRIK